MTKRTVFLIVWSMALAAAVAGTVFTYVSTPDVENFRGFAEPGNSKFEGKITYVFLPVVIMAVAVAYGAFKTPEFETDRGFMNALLLTGFVALCGLGVWLNCKRALDRAAAITKERSSLGVQQLDHPHDQVGPGLALSQRMIF